MLSTWYSKAVAQWTYVTILLVCVVVAVLPSGIALSMASNAVRAQVAAKWQESFARINRAEPGILGLMSFSHVRVLP